MGKVAVIALVAFSISGAYYSMHRNQRTLETSARVSDHQYHVLAREAALDGTSLARQALADSYVSTSFGGHSSEGSFSTTIAVNGNRAKTTSVGQATGAQGQPTYYEVVTEVVRHVVLPPSAPPWMEYAVISEGDLALNGNVDALVVSGSNTNELNANIHTNGTMTVLGNAVDVMGFGTYHVGVSGNENHVNGAFDPHYNPTGIDGHYQADYVEIPEFDVSQIITAVGPDGATLVDQVEGSSLTLSGAYDFGGTRENPYVIHVQGDLNVGSNTTMAGYIMFVVDGNVDFSGSFTNTGSDYSGGEESSMAIYAAGNLSLSGNVDIEAQIFVGGEVSTGNGTPTITGGIVTKSIVDFGGTPNIVYRPPSSALTTPWQDNQLEIELLGYFER